MYRDIAKKKFEELKKNYKKRDILVLGIESSCDETSIAVVKNGREILSNVIATQIEIHARFGGVVPEDDKIIISTSENANNFKFASNRAFDILASNIIHGEKKLFDCTYKYKGFIGSIKKILKRSV